MLCLYTCGCPLVLIDNRPPASAAAREARESAAELGGELGRRMQGFVEAHQSGSLLAALVAGFAVAVGVSPRLREFLMDVLKN